MAVGAALTVACGPLSSSGPEPVPIVRVDQLDELPVARELPDVEWPNDVEGSVTVQSVLDTAGRITKDMVLAVDDPGQDLRQLETIVLSKAAFSPPRVRGQPRRAMVEIMLDTRARTATVLPRLSDKIAWAESMVDDKPEVVSGPMLNYPEQARREGITGRVLVQAIIGVNGRAEERSVRVIRHVHPELDLAARYYVHNAKFKPARIGGRPVRTLVNLPIDFKIKGVMWQR